jgi:hypothetical protein
MKKHLIVIGIAVLLLIVGLSGCNDLGKLLDPIVQRAEPYTSKIVRNDISLRAYVNSIIKNCTAGDRECQVNAVYRYIVENYNYVPDPEGVELIQAPQETIQVGGGDCEDLSILLNSLLENIGIKTYLVLTDTHAYSLAYDIDTDNLWNYIEQSLTKQVEKEFGESIRQTYENTFVLEGYSSWYYGGNGTPVENFDTDYVNIGYELESSCPIDFYVVKSKDDFQNHIDGESYTHYTSCQEENVLSLTDACSHLVNYGGIILFNDNWEDATIQIEIEFYFHPSFYNLFEDEIITYYSINGKKCIVLDCTAGEYGYPGYDAGLTGEKIAIDPITQKYYYLV